jgi:hypothetical protein
MSLTVNLDKLVPLARIAIRGFKEPCIVLGHVHKFCVPYITEDTRETGNVEVSWVERIITEDILKPEESENATNL